MMTIKIVSNWLARSVAMLSCLVAVTLLMVKVAIYMVATMMPIMEDAMPYEYRYIGAVCAIAFLGITFYSFSDVPWLFTEFLFVKRGRNG